jgi:DNA-directed RNA polymerase subunit beta
VFFGDIPLMTENGTFIINGTERVIVSQLHRSPGVFFTKESAHTFLAKIIPYRGSWVEFEYDQKNILYVRIDRKRKFLGSVFLRALGLTTDEGILRQFYTPIKAKLPKSGDNVELSFDKRVLDQEEAKERHSIRGRRTVRTVFAGVKLDQKMADSLTKNNEASAKVDFAVMDKAVFLGDVVDFNSGEVLFEAGESLPADWADTLREHEISEIDVIFPEWDLVSDILLNTVRKDTSKSFEQSIIEIYRRMRPGDPPTLESAKALFEGMFFDAQSTTSRVGRFKFNIKLDLESPVTQRDDVRRRLLRRHQLPAPPPAGRRPRRRHRQPRQPPRSRGWRAAREASSTSVSSAWSAVKRRCRSIRTSTPRCRTTDQLKPVIAAIKGVL